MIWRLVKFIVLKDCVMRIPAKEARLYSERGLRCQRKCMLRGGRGPHAIQQALLCRCWGHINHTLSNVDTCNAIHRQPELAHWRPININMVLLNIKDDKMPFRCIACNPLGCLQSLGGNW
jgi:hypothetical protein